MRLLILFILLFALCHPVQALSMNVEGNYVDEEVKVTLDEEAFVIFRMNYGTPIYAEGSTAYFIPRVTGELYIEAIAGDERINKTISITQRQSGGGGGGTDYYTLPDGTFTVTANGKEYPVKWRTALGALEKASKILGFSYTVEKKSWGLYVKCIKSKCEKSDGDTSGWMYWVSGSIPGVASDEYEIKEGDVIIWYFSRSMDDTPDASPYKIKITVSTGYIVGVEPSWSSTSSASSSHGTYTTSTTPEKFSKSILLLPDVEKIVELGKITEKIDIVSITLKSNRSKQILLEVYEDSIISAPGKIYRCFSIHLSDSGIEGVIEFRVSKEWLNLCCNPDQIVLIKYRNGEHVELPTELVREDGEYYYYKSKLKSFSTFAIIAKWKGFPLNTTDDRILRALEWLRTIQNDDGGFSNPNEESDIAKTSWAVMALAAAGENPNEWVKNNTSPIDYIRNNLNESIGRMGTADYARTILALKAADENPRNFSGINLVDMLKSKIKSDGQIGDFIYTTIWGILALKACDEDVNKSVEWLKQQQNEDGGFAWATGEKSDYDDTAAAIQALISAREPKDSEVIKKALDYLKTGQNEDGGFRYFGTSASNAASDAWIIQALVAAGENPMEWKKNNVSVVDHLLSLQTEEGYFNYTSYQTSNPGYMTACAIMALLGKSHPVKAGEILDILEKTDDSIVIPAKTTISKQTKTVLEETTTPETTPFKEAGDVKITSEITSESQETSNTTHIILIAVLVLAVISTIAYIRMRR